MGDLETIKEEFKSLNPKEEGKGGFRASIFVYVYVALENMGFIANMVSLVLYFLYVMYFQPAAAANTLTNFMGATFLLTLVGGFISDTYLNRLHTIVIFTVIEIVALVLVTIQAHAKSLHPEYCGRSSCIEGKAAFMLYASLALLALGTGGVRGVVPSLGADQFDQNDPKEAKALATYFNWLTLSTVLGASVGVTVIVWVSMKKDWYKGFMITTIATFVGIVILACGKPFYRERKRGDSPFVRVAQVIILAVKNYGLTLPEKFEDLYEINEKEATDRKQVKLAHTRQFRFLDKAAIVPQDKELNPWSVCTITQVEEVKVLIRMLPILFSTIIMNTCLAQLQTFSVQQGYMMDTNIGKFELLAPSVPIIPLLFMVILIPLYEFLFVPFARKFTGHPTGITQLQRVGIGLVLSAISMTVAGVVEVKRRHQMLTNREHPQMSVLWLSFQYGIFGIADMFTLVGLLEFFYKEAPSCMKSLSTSFTFLSLSFGYFLSSVLVDTINAVTKRVTPSKLGWLHGDNINYNNLNLFYWFLAVLSCINFGIYLLSASWYKYKVDDVATEASKGLEDLVISKEEKTPESEIKTVLVVEESAVSEVKESKSTQDGQAQKEAEKSENVTEEEKFEETENVVQKGNEVEARSLDDQKNKIEDVKETAEKNPQQQTQA